MLGGLAIQFVDVELHARADDKLKPALLCKQCLRNKRGWGGGGSARGKEGNVHVLTANGYICIIGSRFFTIEDSGVVVGK